MNLGAGMRDVIKPYFYVGLIELREIIIKPVLLLIFLVQIIVAVFFVTLGAIDEWMTSEPVTWFAILALIPFSVIRLVILLSAAFKSSDRFMTDLILVRGVSRLEYFVGKIAAIYSYFAVESLIFMAAIAYFSRAVSTTLADDIDLVGLLFAYLILLINFALVGSTVSFLAACGLGTRKTIFIFFLILFTVLLFLVLIGSIEVAPETVFLSYGDIVRGLNNLSLVFVVLFFVSLVSSAAGYLFFARRDF